MSSSSPYGDLQSGTSKKVLSYLPLHFPAFSEALGDLVLERIDGSNADDTAVCRDLLNHEIELGNSYPQEHTLDDAQFKAYFFSHDAFVVRQTSNRAICGMFYIKPNFPGRCSHICNGGFVTAPQFRRRGVARLMAVQFQRLGKDLGYSASFFNLVFVSNVASVELWKNLGFIATGRVPHAGRLKGHDELVDALQFYKAF